MSRPSSIIVYDTETTGLIANAAIPLKEQPQIIELYASKLDGETLEEVETFHSLFYAKNITPEITKITSITPEMVREAPTFPQMVDPLARFFLGVEMMAGHNLSYDRDMLSIELRRLGRECRFPWPPRHLCTVEATEHLEGFRLGLTALHEKLFGCAFEGAHRAKSDVDATVKCFRKLVEEGTISI